MKLKLLLIPIIALVAVQGARTVVNAAPAPPSVTVNVNVGGGGSGIAANGFFPDTVVIHKGDSIHFTNPYEEIHTTTYLQPNAEHPALLIPDPSGGPGLVFNPLASDPTHPGLGSTDFDPLKYFNSGIMPKGASADVAFNVISTQEPNTSGPIAQSATYTFLCLVHPDMKLKVVVTSQPVSTTDQVDVDKLAATQKDALIATGTGLAKDTILTKATNASGTATYDLLAGNTQGRADVMQFLPAGPTNITTGDSVRWSSITDTPHTVTFLSGAPIIPLTIDGSHPVAFNPGAVLPSGGNSYNGSGVVNSGLIDKTGQVPGGSSFTLAFTKAGTYTYICLLHSDQGMAGTIVVSDKVAAPPPPANNAGRPSTGTIAPPNTGSGPDASGNGSLFATIALIAAAGFGVIVVGARNRRDQDA